MNHTYDIFYKSLREKLIQGPPKSLDQKILLLASEKLQSHKNHAEWLYLASGFTTCLIVFLTISGYFNHQQNFNKQVINESPEMILNFNSIEMMADASVLSENEWKKIEGTK